MVFNAELRTINLKFVPISYSKAIPIIKMLCNLDYAKVRLRLNDARIYQQHSSLNLCYGLFKAIFYFIYLSVSIDLKCY